MDSYSLKQVNEYIKQVFALNFEESLWIEAEISQLKEVRGQVYLEFIDKSEDTDKVVAKAQGVIWFKSLMFIKKKLGELADSILQEGRQIRFKAKIEFHEIYGLKLSLEDIEPAFTLGMVELNRQKTISKLSDEGLIGKNKEKELSLILKNIAIISSEKAAGLQDFYEHLNNNPYGYKFNSILFDSSMQGNNVERDIVRNLTLIKDRIDSFDCVAIIRGGGSKMDLSYFDNYNISANVAKFPIPVLTGIGHDIDQNVIELVAHTPLKTPTAVADFLVDHNLFFEMKIIEIQKEIGSLSQYLIRDNLANIDDLNHIIKRTTSIKLSNSSYELEHLFNTLKNKTSQKLIIENSKIAEISNLISYSDPHELLKKGYSITTKNGKIIKSTKNIALNDIVVTMLEDGKFESKVF